MNTAWCGAMLILLFCPTIQATRTCPSIMFRSHRKNTFACCPQDASLLDLRTSTISRRDRNGSTSLHFRGTCINPLPRSTIISLQPRDACINRQLEGSSIAWERLARFGSWESPAVVVDSLSYSSPVGSFRRQS